MQCIHHGKQSWHQPSTSEYGKFKHGKLAFSRVHTTNFYRSSPSGFDIEFKKSSTAGSAETARFASRGCR